jgi:hypothetical protein
MGAGQAACMAANIGVFARQPAFPHLAVALCVLTTKVVFTRASLLRTVWAVAAGCCQERQYDQSQYSDILEDVREFHLLLPSKSC